MIMLVDTMLLREGIMTHHVYVNIMFHTDATYKASVITR